MVRMGRPCQPRCPSQPQREGLKYRLRWFDEDQTGFFFSLPSRCRSSAFLPTSGRSSRRSSAPSPRSFPSTVVARPILSLQTPLSPVLGRSSSHRGRSSALRAPALPRRRAPRSQPLRPTAHRGPLQSSAHTTPSLAYLTLLASPPPRVRQASVKAHPIHPPRDPCTCCPSPRRTDATYRLPPTVPTPNPGRPPSPSITENQGSQEAPSGCQSTPTSHSLSPWSARLAPRHLDAGAPYKSGQALPARRTTPCPTRPLVRSIARTLLLLWPPSRTPSYRDPCVLSNLTTTHPARACHLTQAPSSPSLRHAPARCTSAIAPKRTSRAPRAVPFRVSTTPTRTHSRGAVTAPDSPASPTARPDTPVLTRTATSPRPGGTMRTRTPRRPSPRLVHLSATPRPRVRTRTRCRSADCANAWRAGASHRARAWAPQSVSAYAVALARARLLGCPHARGG